MFRAKFTSSADETEASHRFLRRSVRISGKEGRFEGAFLHLGNGVKWEERPGPLWRRHDKSSML